MPDKMFTLFTTLAPELREMIWIEAIPEQRLVHLKDTYITPRHVSNDNTIWDPVESWSPDDYLYSNAPIPALLHVCSESRRVAIESGYTLSFGTPGKNDARVWFNNTRDVLYFPRIVRDATLAFPSYSALINFYKDRLKNTQRIAIQEHLSWSEEVVNIMRILEGVDEMWVIPEHCGWDLKNCRQEKDNAGNPWTYVDMKDLEVMGICPEDYSAPYRPMWSFPSSSWSWHNKPFKAYADNIELSFKQSFPGRPEESVLVPKVKIGLVMPENKVKGTVELSKQFRRKERMLALVIMLRSKLRKSRKGSIFDNNYTT